MVLIETSFPRGGTVNKTTDSTTIKFGARQDKKKSKKQNDKNRKVEHEGDPEIGAISAELLTFKTIQEGMILMGCVKTIDPIYMIISLPGRILGKVVASNISVSYTKVINTYVDSSEPVENFQPLNEMYKIGQIVYAKVIEIKQKDNRKLEINLSLKPADVHTNMYHEHIRKGMLFTGAVKEIQEHGYIIESGIKNLRCFLPIGKAQSDYSLGQLIFMKIDKLTQSSTASTAICKAVTDKEHKIKDLIEPNLDYIVPSTVVNFTVTKILKDGLQGTIMNGTFKAYINEHQLGELFANPNDYEVNSTLNARLLYVMPLTKLAYLSLNLNLIQDEQKSYQKGDFVENATVHRIGTSGIILNLDGQSKGLISFASIKANYIGNFDIDVILEKYVTKTKLKVRIIDFDPMDSLYFCTDNPSIVNEKLYTLADLKCGDFVTATILEHDKIGGYVVSMGNVRGLIEKIFLSSTSLHLSENAKLRCRVMAINPDRHIAYLTNRPEYMPKDCRILTKISEVKKNKIFLGTVVKISDEYLIVKFFNNIKGILNKSELTGCTDNDFSSFYEGQTMNFRIIRNNKDKIVVGLASIPYEIGDICTAKVNSIIENGLDVTLNDKNHMKALVPTRMLSDFPELVNVHLKTFEPEVDLEIACIVNNIFSVRDVCYFKVEPSKHWKAIQPGDIIRGFIKNIDNNIINILLPLTGYNKLVKVHMEMFLEKAIENSNISVYADQVVYVKVLSIESFTQNITVTAKLTEVWDLSLKTTANIFAKYLDELKEIKEALKRQGKAIGNFELGEIVPANVISYDEETRDCFVDLQNNVRGIIKSNITVTDKIVHPTGKSLNCIVLWIDYLNEIVFLSHKPRDLKDITKGTNVSESIKKQIGVVAKILVKTNDLMVCSLKRGNNPVVVVPTRVHYNDFEDSIGSGVKEGEICRLVVIHDKYPIAVFESTWKLWNSDRNRKRKNSNNNVSLESKRMKKAEPAITINKFTPLIAQEPSVSKGNITSDASEDEDIALDTSEDEDLTLDTSEDDDVTSNTSEDEDMNKLWKEEENDTETEELQNQPKKSTTSKTKTKKSNTKSSDDEDEKKIVDDFKRDLNAEERKHKPALPGAFGFWSNDLQTLTKNSENEKDESSDDDDDDDDDADKATENKRKKKLTPAERFKAARAEEARLREIEEKYANPNIQPETADQFDRLVLSNPNSSKTWIEYMVFHLTATEIDKARIIARKALKSINFREELELINVWIALLNLELSYGTKESFDEVLKESLLSNDPYKIYSRVIQILTDAQKTKELIEICTIVTKKFKDNPEAWKIVANAYFETGSPEKANQLLQKALKSLPDRYHINTIVIFANLNTKHGDKETAQTLLEHVLTSYPGRIDIWSQYVDMLIKDQKIESARATLERAVIQKLPLKKMRTLFKKYLEFEERFGTEENVQKVKEMAANYVKQESGS